MATPVMVWQEPWTGSNGTTLPSSPNIWTEVREDSGLVNNNYRINNTGASFLTSARCETDLGSTDQYGTASILSLVDSGGVSVIGVALRFSGSTDTYYYLTCGCNAAAGHGSGEWQAGYYVAGAETVLQGPTAYTYADGDVPRLEIVGSTLTGYINGVQKFSISNSVITTGTKAGVAGYRYLSLDAPEEYTTEAGIMVTPPLWTPQILVAA